MKWFKHITDSLDDPFIYGLINKHGANGYLVFFGTLEIYSREFKTREAWFLDVPVDYLKSKLQIYHKKTLLEILSYIGTNETDRGQSLANLSSIYGQSLADLCPIYGKWLVNLFENNIQIYIPKFKELMSESTLKKLRKMERNSGTIPDIGRVREAEAEAEAELKAATPTFRVGEGVKKKHYGQNIKPVWLPRINAAAKILEGIPGFNPYAYIQKNLKAHPEALAVALEKTSKQKEFKKSPEAAFNYFLKVESQNYNERDYVEAHKRFKEEMISPEVEALLDMKSL